MYSRASLLRILRQMHLYLGVFTTPAILFFALTGVLQTFSLHESSRDSAYTPPRWIVVLAQLHKKQTTVVPVRKLPATASSAAAAPAKVKESVAAPPIPHAPHPLPLRLFFLVVGISLFASTLTGLSMSWRYRANRLVLSATLLSGIVVPIILIAI